MAKDEPLNQRLKLTRVASMMDVSEHTVRLWIKKGLLPASKICKRWYVTPHDLEKFNRDRNYIPPDAPE